MREIYLDNSATTELDPRVREAMGKYWNEDYGNSSSIHGFGQRARAAEDNAREIISNFIGARPNDIIFTSGATEANNAAFWSLIFGLYYRKRHDKNPLKDYLPVGHVVSSSIEHNSVRGTLQNLEDKGVISLTLVSPRKDGLVLADDVLKVVREETILVSIMHANSEIGTIQPVAEIGRRLAVLNNGRKDKKIYFHSDIVQAFQYLPIRMDAMRLDLASISCHKIYGPKGVGALYVRRGTPFAPYQTGGHQQNHYRGGTTPTPLIVGFGRAVELLKAEEHPAEKERIGRFRDKLEEGILKISPVFKINGSQKDRIPSIANINFGDTGAEPFALWLTQDAGLAVSNGSACDAGSIEPSHVLRSIGLEHREILGSVRFSLGRFTAEEDIKETIKKVKATYEKVRKFR